MAAGFTENNTFHEVMGQSGKEMHLFFSDGFCSFIPEEYKDIPLCRWKDSFRMPWGLPFPMDDFLNAANMVEDADRLWDLVPLWADGEHFSVDGNDRNSVCLMVPKYPENDSIRPAVIICPGGAYEELAFMGEGIKTAKRLEDAGYRTFILSYRYSPNRYPAPQMDLALAIQHVRANAQHYLIDPNDLMILGYSAGGHLCASTTALRDEIAKDLADEMEEVRPDLAESYRDISIRPDQVCLCYPVISFLSECHERSFENLSGGKEELREHLSIEKQVDPDFPRTFIWACEDDSMVPPSNAVRMGKALEEKKVPFMLKMYPQGEHGCSLGIGTSAEGWVDDMLKFMR
jgi:acetyl esterase/lipase